MLNLQQRCPPDFLGRVSTLVRSAQLSCIALLPVLGSMVMGGFSPFGPLVLSAVLTFGLWLWSLCWRAPADATREG